MEPWEYMPRDDDKRKSIIEKTIHAAVIIYAGFAIGIAGAIAESVTIPLSRRYKRHKDKRRESQ